MFLSVCYLLAGYLFCSAPRAVGLFARVVFVCSDANIVTVTLCEIFSCIRGRFTAGHKFVRNPLLEGAVLCPNNLISRNAARRLVPGDLNFFTARNSDGFERDLSGLCFNRYSSAFTANLDRVSVLDICGNAKLISRAALKRFNRTRICCKALKSGIFFRRGIITVNIKKP